MKNKTKPRMVFILNMPNFEAYCYFIKHKPFISKECLSAYFIFDRIILIR